MYRVSKTLKNPPESFASLARPLQPADEDVVVLPTSVAQQGFWYLDQLDPGNPAYNIAVRFQLNGPLQVPVLLRAMNEVVRRQEALRTVIPVVEGQPVQLIAQWLTIPIPVSDLSGLPADERIRRSEELTLEEAHRRFNLSEGPLIRARLLRLSALEHILLVTVHHIISDGWSIGIISHELGVLYDAYCQGRPSPLPELRLQFGDFAIWQNEWLKQGKWQAQLTYWKQRLADLPTLEVPTDHPRPLVQTSNGHIESILLPTELTESLKRVSNDHGVTFYMLALAALKSLISRLTGKSDIFVGTLLAGRSRVELEPLVGVFINPIVLRTELSGDPTFSEVLERVRDTVLQAIDHQDAPFERVVEALKPKRDLSRHAVFQINFIYQRDFVRPFHASGLTLTALPSRSPGAIYDLNFFMVERADGWRASCEYNTDLYDSATVKRMLVQFQSLLESIRLDPTLRISQIPIVSGIETEPADAERSALESALDSVEPEATPLDEMEARLLAIWEQVLGVKQLDIHDNFFDVGGHSLLAATLRAQIEKTLGTKLSIATIFEAPTVQQLAARLRPEASAPHRARLHVIQSEGTRLPFVLVTSQPPIYQPLSRRLGLDQPILSLRLPEVSELPPDFSVPDIAAHLVGALRQDLPNVPYRLGGWCVSGVIAYEMARQLKLLGEEVDLLVLLDSNSPEYVRSFYGLKAFHKRVCFRVQKTWHHLQRLGRMPRREAAADFAKRLGGRLRHWLQSVGMIPATPVDNENELTRFLQLQGRAVENFRPGTYSGRVILFRSAEMQTGLFRDPLMGWGELVREGLVMHELPGGHKDLLVEPNVALLAEKLAEDLNSIEDNGVKGTRIVAHSTRNSYGVGSNALVMRPSERS